MKKSLSLLVAVAAAVITVGLLRRTSPPKINFTRVQRTTLISTLSTNGKVEPSEWQAIRAERSGIIGRVTIHDGQQVKKDEVIATISDPALQADIQAGEAKVAEARANLTALNAGGRPAEVSEIDNSLAQARLELQQQQKDYASLQRLRQKQAATAVETEAAGQKIKLTQSEIDGLQERRRSLVTRTDIAAASARLQDAEAALDLARQRAAQSVVRAPLGGTIYGLTIRDGAYVNPGDLLANVGRLDRLRVRVYVDEPELGRVSEGQPVTITWDALPGKQWRGSVERKPASIQPLGSRQVGEVLCWIDNPGRELIPGTNVDAVIRTAVVPNALVIPKETLHQDARGTFVFRLAGDTVERRTIQTGTSSISEVQVTEGLAASDAVALPSDVPLKPGDHVTPQMNPAGLG